ncbi:MAG: hypothetical protein ACI8PT_004604, partial [Gammaproteobacteria bacterium]
MRRRWTPAGVRLVPSMLGYAFLFARLRNPSCAYSALSLRRVVALRLASESQAQ